MTKHEFMNGIDMLQDKEKGYKFSMYQERRLFEEFGDMDNDKFEKICKEFTGAPEFMNSYDTLKWVMDKINEALL